MFTSSPFDPLIVLKSSSQLTSVCYFLSWDDLSVTEVHLCAKPNWLLINVFSCHSYEADAHEGKTRPKVDVGSKSSKLSSILFRWQNLQNNIPELAQQ